MSFLGALFKPFKKLVKKIGKGIKKVAKKIGKAVGKLGIVGQIGMMFLMPYASAALGSFFGASGTLSSWGATLLSKPGIGRAALGHTLNAINTVGTMAGKAYTSVTGTINNAFDTVMKKGTQFLERTGLKTPGASTPTDALADLSSAVESGQAIDPSLRSVKDTNLMRIKPESNLTEELYKGYQKQATEDLATKSPFSSSLESIAGGGGEVGRTQSLLESTIDPVQTAATPTFNISTPTLPNVADETLGSKLSGFVGEQVEAGLTKAKNTIGTEIQNIITAPVDAVKDKATEALKVKTLETLGLEDPVQGSDYSQYKTPVPEAVATDSGIDFTNSYAINAFAQQGNNTVPYGLSNAGHVSSIFDPQNNPTTNSFMTEYYLAPNVNRQLGVV